MLSGGHCWAAGRKEERESKYLKPTEETTVFNVLSSNVTACVDVVLKITLNLRYCNISESKTNHQSTQNTKSPAILCPPHCDDAAVRVFVLNIHVPQVKNGSQNSEDAHLRALINTCKWIQNITSVPKSSERQVQPPRE